MKRISLGVVLACFIGSSVAMAAGDPIKERKDLMKGNGDAMKTVTAMMKGEKPYDAKTAAGAMKSVHDVLDKFVTLFPKGSETGGETAAKPEIWSNMADFEKLAKAAKDATAKAETAAAGGADTFKTAMADVGKACAACHEKYRVEKK